MRHLPRTLACHMLGRGVPPHGGRGRAVAHQTPRRAARWRVRAARQRAEHRLAGTGWHVNAEVPGSELRRRFAPARGALVPLERAMELGEISARGVDRVLRVSWTLADLAGRPRPSSDDCDAALGLWLGVRR